MDRRKDNLVTLAVVAAIAILVAVLFLGPKLQSATAGDTTTRAAPAAATDSGAALTDDTAADTTAADTTAADTTAADTTAADTTATFSDGPYIELHELPDEAIDTLLLIDSDGPFPYSKDGSTFQNREGFLPGQDRSYYREYTVETPGSSDRGARRIVGGDDGDLWYTSDHYESFREIVGW